MQSLMIFANLLFFIEIVKSKKRYSLLTVYIMPKHKRVMKKIIIVGASSGIGLSVAEALASRGVKVGLAARHVKKLHELKEKYPDFVEYESIDITHQNAPELLEKLINKTGGMDIYVHVAGIGAENPELTPQSETETVMTNAVGFARMMCAAYNYYRSNLHKGQIVGITSVAGTNGIGSIPAYSASKRFASTYMTALEQRATQERMPVIFTDIRPGWIRTPLLDENKSYPMEMTLEYVTPQIIKAIVKHPRVQYIYWRYGLLAGVWKVIPDALWIKMPLINNFMDKLGLSL